MIPPVELVARIVAFTRLGDPNAIGVNGEPRWTWCIGDAERFLRLYPEIAIQLTKTPSADHDDGNLRDKLDIAISALEFARDGFERTDIKHIEYRVGVYTTACDALDKIALPSIPNHQPHAVSRGWHDGVTIPPVERGREKEYVVAVFRQHSGKVYTFAASYLNAYPLVYQDECPNGDGCDGNGCDDGCPTTGWFRLTGDDGEAETYVSLNIRKGDRLMGWRELPQWEEMLSANVPAPPSPAKTGGVE